MILYMVHLVSQSAWYYFISELEADPFTIFSRGKSTQKSGPVPCGEIDSLRPSLLSSLPSSKWASLIALADGKECHRMLRWDVYELLAQNTVDPVNNV